MENTIEKLLESLENKPLNSEEIEIYIENLEHTHKCGQQNGCGNSLECCVPGG